MEENRNYVSLDNDENLDLALKEPLTFFARFPIPILIDEVQRAPNLFRTIKYIVDQSKEKSQVWLTGSQQFAMMKNLGDSLAGRVGIIDMHGLTQAEKQMDPKRQVFIPSPDRIREKATWDYHKTFEEIFNGSYPEINSISSINKNTWFKSYVRTRLMKDFFDIIEIQNRHSFEAFLASIAANTGNLLNYSSIANDIGISPNTIKAWVNALETLGIIFLLYPYRKNQAKRLISTPKIYFSDSGLCCYLNKISSSEELIRHRLSGAIVETYVVNEIIKSHSNNFTRNSFSFYRDAQGHEIDLLIETGEKIYPIEIKQSVSARRDQASSFSFIDEKIRGFGAIVCFADMVKPIADNLIAFPISLL